MDDETITGFVGDYEVVMSPPLGSGTFGSVHTATHRITGDTFAAKQILYSQCGTENTDMRDMAKRELKIIQDLQNHDNIVRIYDHIIRQKTYWIFLEYCDLSNLRVYLVKNKDLSMLDKLKIMSQSASAVAFMHSQPDPIIHRDIKLENILMKREGREDVVKITDFGVSKICDKLQTVSQALKHGQVMTTTCGSSYFMAPEFYAESEYDSSIDVYSLGLVYLVLLENKLFPDLIPLSGTSFIESKVSS